MPGYSSLCVFLIAAASMACSDPGLPTAGGEKRRLDWAGGRPHFTTSSETDALAISDPYVSRELFSGFNVTYDEFFENPEAISDAEFQAQGPSVLFEWESDQIETDAARVHEYCTSSTGGGGGPDVYMSGTGEDGSAVFWLTCEEQLDRCWNRCRRIAWWDRRARALCWAGCMAAYALCVRRRNGG